MAVCDLLERRAGRDVRQQRQLSFRHLLLLLAGAVGARQLLFQEFATASGERPSRRSFAAAAAAAAAATGSSAGAEELPSAALASAQQKAVKEAASAVSLGLVGEELVLPRWFAGEWACAGELFKVETGGQGQKALATALPGVLAALLRSNKAVGMDEGEFRARRRWTATERAAPAGAGPGAVEDPSGLPAGAAAAAEVLAGLGVRPVAAGDSTWEVAGSWQLRAAGAVARQDPELPGAIRVSELLEVRRLPAAAGAAVDAAVRVVTIWRQAPLAGSEELQKELRPLGEPDKSRTNIMQAVQVAYILPEASAASEKNLASVTTRFVYTPIRDSGR